MSGLFWEPEKQPNICEAATGFTFSAINLLVAIPMFVVDAACTLVLNIVSLLSIVTLPAMEYVTLALDWCMDTFGISFADLPLSGSCTFMAAVLAMMAYDAYCHQGPGNKTSGSWLKFTRKMLATLGGMLWLIVFLTTPDFAESTVYPRMVLFYFAAQAVEMVGPNLFKEYNNFKVARSAEAGSFEAFSNGYSKLLGLESYAILAIAAFGYPSVMDTAQNTLPQYFCLVPIVPLLIGFGRWKETVAEESPVAVTNVNGDAQPVIEKQEEEVAAVQAQPEQPAAQNETDKPEEAAAEKSGDADATDSANKAGGETKAAEEAKPADDAKSGNIAVEKIVARFTWMCDCMMATVKPVLSTVCKCASCVRNLPWTACLLFVTTHLSPVVWAHAWFSITSLQISYALAALAILSPVVVNRLAAAGKISDQIAVLADEVTTFSLMCIQYSLISTPASE